jgi:hypothetical protein
LDQSYPPSKLLIEFKGVEKVKYEVGSGDDSTIKKAKQKIIHLSFVGASFQNSIVASGDYVFPFSIQLPDNLQSSFNYSGNSADKSHFRIKYKIKASIVDEVNPHKTLNSMIAKENVIISRPSIPLQENIMKEVCGDV